jgi:predicted PurR-regulated permease PerM
MSKPWSDTLRYWMLTFVILFVFGMMIYLKAIFTPLAVAAFIAYLINPIANYIDEKTPLSRKAIVNIVYLLVITLFVVIPFKFFPIIVEQVNIFSIELVRIYSVIAEFISTPISVPFLDFTFEPVNLLPSIDEIPFLNVGFLSGELLHIVESITQNALWFLVLLVVIYLLLLDWDKIKKFVLSLIPEAGHDDLRRLYKEIVLVWNGYLRGNIILMGITFILFAIAWTIIGLPFPIILAFMMGLFSIVPDLGAMISATITVIIAFIEGSSTLTMANGWYALLVFVIYFILINVKNLWIRSILFGRSVNMHEGLVFILIILSVLVQGVLGAIIVIPLVATINIIGKYILNKIYLQDPFAHLEE